MMTPEKIYRCIKDVSWEKIQAELPEGTTVTVNGYKIPPKPANELQLFWDHICLVDKETGLIDKTDFYQTADFPNYKFVNDK